MIRAPHDGDAGTRHPRRAPLPHPLIPVCALTGAVVALWPSGLPRPTVISMLLTVGAVAIGTVAGMLVTRNRRPAAPRTAAITLIVAAGAVVILGLVATAWQNTIRAELGAPEVGWEWTAAAVIPAAAVFAAITRIPRTTAVTSAMTFALLAGYLPAAQANTPKTSPTVPAKVLYEPLSDDALSARAHHLSDRWVRAGGLHRSAVVIAVPTGSGWVDSSAIDGFGARFAGDVEVLALQYAQQPSWQAFVGDRSAAGRSATALLDAVVAHTRQDRTPPRIYLYGQSLGAIGADTARAWAEAHHPGAVTEALLSGVPADSIAPDIRPGTKRVVHGNVSDPVTRWSPSLLWRPAHSVPDTSPTGREAHRAPWLPVVTFVATSVDLLSALDGSAGVGHRYGPEQAWP